MSNFIVEFPLKTEKYQEDILNKRFEIGRQIYNSLVNVTQKRYKEMIKTKKYRTLLSSLTGNKKSDKEIWKQINDIRKQYGMSEYSFHEDVKKVILLIIYKATFPNGKMYIGKTTKTLEERMRQHKSDSKRHKNYAFYNAMNKYGFDNIKWEIIDDTTKNEIELSQKEIYWIKYYNTYIHASNSNGYNTTLGGEGVSGLKYSEESKENLSKIRQGEGNSFYGRHHTDETKEKISKSKLGKYKGKDNPNYGNKWTDEQKNKISTINKGRLLGENNPSVVIDICLARKIKIDLYNGVSMKDICDKYKVSRDIVANIKYLRAWEELLPELNDKIFNSIKHISKIDIELVKKIKIELANGRKPIDIVNEYNVTKDTVYNIKSLRGYKNILSELNSLLKTS